MEIKKLWNNNDIDVVKINGRWFALSGWNGEIYVNCWETDENTFYLEDGKRYDIKPIFKGVGEPDEDGNFEEYEIVSYELL